MATIMAHDCFSPSEEWIYDSHANDFVAMIMKSIHIRKTFPAISEELHEHDMDKSKAVMDIGWIPPLYYIAIKNVGFIGSGCRPSSCWNQRALCIRRGFGDAEIIACVARKVVEVEERDSMRICRRMMTSSFLAS